MWGGAGAPWRWWQGVIRRWGMCWGFCWAWRVLIGGRSGVWCWRWGVVAVLRLVMVFKKGFLVFLRWLCVVVLGFVQDTKDAKGL